jgi:hypothetical protein
MAVEAAVERRRDDWVSVPAEGELGGSERLELRPGADSGKVRIRSSTPLEIEVDIVQVRQGLGLIEKEHQR